MKWNRSGALACAVVAAVLAGCGGGGGGGGGGSSDNSDLVNNTLYVSVSYANATVPLYGASTVTPTLSGFQGRTPHCSLSAGNLPPGMSMAGDCSISGRPTSAGPFNFHVAVGADGISGSVDVAGTVWVASPVVTYAGHSYPALPVGYAVDDAPQISGWTAPSDVAPTFVYSLASGSLPPGLTLNPATGHVSGTTTTAGTFTAGIAATMTTGVGTYKMPAGTYTVNVNVDSFAYLDDYNTGSDANGYFHAYVGVDYTSTPYTNSPVDTLSAFHLISGSLPAGLTLDANGGAITGRPQAITAPTDALVGATDTKYGMSGATQGTFKVRVDVPTTVDWQSNTMPLNTQSDVFITRHDVTTINPNPVSIVATQRAGSCVLPPGVTMLTSGSVTGTPTLAGTYDCTVDFTLTLNGESWTQQGQLTLTVQ